MSFSQLLRSSDTRDPEQAQSGMMSMTSTQFARLSSLSKPRAGAMPSRPSGSRQSDRSSRVRDEHALMCLATDGVMSRSPERSNEMSNILETYQQRRLTGGSKKKDVKNEHIFDESELDSIVYDNNCVVGGTVHALITLLTHHEYLGRACPSRFSYLSFSKGGDANLFHLSQGR